MTCNICGHAKHGDVTCQQPHYRRGDWDACGCFGEAFYAEMYTVTQLPTRKDRVRQIATTKEKYIYGPATVLLVKHSDGSQNQIEFEYLPKASIDELFRIQAENAEKSNA